jgi:hypothetical protein
MLSTRAEIGEGMKRNVGDERQSGMWAIGDKGNARSLLQAVCIYLMQAHCICICVAIHSISFLSLNNENSPIGAKEKG